MNQKTMLEKQIDAFTKGLNTEQQNDACKLIDLGVIPDGLCELKEV